MLSLSISSSLKPRARLWKRLVSTTCRSKSIAKQAGLLFGDKNVRTVPVLNTEAAVQAERKTNASDKAFHAEDVGQEV